MHAPIERRAADRRRQKGASLRFREPAQLLRALWLVGALGVLTGCGAKSDAELIASAKSSMAAGDPKAAAIELKAALQKNADAGEARFLLGKLLLDSGDASGALIELVKARDTHFDDNRLLPELAQAYLARGQLKMVVDQFATTKLSDPKAAAELQAKVGLAYFFQGDAERARTANDEALRLDAKNATARVQQARMLAADGKFDRAIAITEGVTASDPKFVQGWMLLGELMVGGKHDNAAAAKAFGQALQLDPRQPGAHEWLIRLAEERGDAADVKARIEQLQKALPGTWQAYFFGAQLALMNNDLDKAGEAVQQLLRMAPNSPQALQLAGNVEMRSGATGQALRHLSQAVQLAPQVGTSRYLLGAAQLELGRPSDTLQTLKPLLERKQPTADVLGLAAQAYVQSGRLDEALPYLRRAAQADPKALQTRVTLALVQVLQGDAKAGLAELEALAGGDKGTSADLALIRVLVTRRDADGAIKAAERMVAKTPNDALAHLVHGQALLLRNRRDEARAEFDKALELKPGYFAAVSELAAIDIADRKVDAADARYQKFLEREPDNFRAQLALADLRERAGTRADTVEPLLRAAVKGHSDEPAPRLALVAYYLMHRKADAALQAAQDAVIAIPADLQLLDALGTAQMASGNTRQGLATLVKVAAQSNTVEANMRLAQIYAGMKDYPSASEALRRALDIAPQSEAAQRMLIELALANKRVPDALKVARDVQRQRPREAVGYLMEAGIYGEQKAWAPAVAAAREAFARERNSSVAMRLHSFYLAAGQVSEADALATTWMREHPGDPLFLFHLGSMALERKNYPTAEARFRELLEASPGNPVALNDLAYVLLLQGKPGALPLAERATRAAPDEPAFMDTMARALQAEKRPKEALDWARKAVDKAPEKAEYRLHLARLLIDSGERAKAREELDRLAALGGRFAGQDEVARLRAGL